MRSPKSSILSQALISVTLGLGLILAHVPATKAEMIISGSKRPIGVLVYQGTCTPKTTLGGKFKTWANKQGDGLKNVLNSYKSALGSSDTQIIINETGCQPNGLYVLPGIKSEDTKVQISVGTGQKVLAFKLEGNPLPALCTVPKGKNVILKTPKSEWLRGALRIAGDGGLMCEYK